MVDLEPVADLDGSSGDVDEQEGVNDDADALERRVAGRAGHDQLRRERDHLRWRQGGLECLSSKERI